jgi:glycosyltransferase involved in cell wall biosynthesis
MKPLLSIAIPTHNRAKYAVHAIKSLIEINDSRLEVVISDTSEDCELSDYIEGSSDIKSSSVKIKYIRPKERLDMTGNHNKAIDYTSGDYVCLIGDDDTIAIDLLDAVSFAEKNKIDLLAPNVIANYAWPDFRSRYFGAKHASRLYIAKTMGGVSFVDSNDALNCALKNSAQGTDGLPKIYHGVVRRDILNKIKEKSGEYFHGSSPDVSGAIGLALTSENFCVIDYPLTIPGASGGSNTGRSAMNKHKGKLSQEKQTKSFEKSGWSFGVPKFFSVETVWAHAALETVKKINQDRYKEFNFAKLIGLCRAMHSEYKDEIDIAIIEAAEIVKLPINEFTKNVNKEFWMHRKKSMISVAKRILNPTAAGGRDYISDISNISTTPKLLSNYEVKNNINWDNMELKIKSAINDKYP